MKNYSLNPKPYPLTVAWLYPELMSTYGDRGNITVLQKRAQWRSIELNVVRINQESSHQSLSNCDLLFMGGAQDIQQEIVNKDLLNNKGAVLKQLIENGTPGLFICGAYQFLGNYYKDAYGTEIKGLGVFDMFTETKPDKPRLIGNIVIRPEASSQKPVVSNFFVGFENHGGRTYLSNPTQAFAKVVTGFGNNGEDGTEGIRYKNAIGTYLHGPILPSNPDLADYLLELAFEKKYGKKLSEIKINVDYSQKARLMMLDKLKTSY